MTEINNNMNFEEAYAALSETVEAMEKEDNTIEETLALYERACTLVVFCQRKLNAAKDKITDINERIRELSNSDEPLSEG